MALTLYVDGDRWRAHLKDTLVRLPGLVPVVKGNGYGFGLHRLARKAQWLGVDTLALGTYDEVPEVLSRFGGSVLVMAPFRPFSPDPDDARVIHTIGRLEDLDLLRERAQAAGVRPRVVLERMTSMRRHGFSPRGLREATRAIKAQGGVEVVGVALHLPLEGGSQGTEHLSEVERVLTDVVAAGVGDLHDHGHPHSRTVWVSHLSEAELVLLSDRYPDHTFRPRVGTSLWLGDREALKVRATVLDAHAVQRGDVYGYRGRSAPRAGTLLVVAGGTSHGIGLEAPTGEATLRARASSIARGGLDAIGLVRSPYTVGGKQRLFAEPPHMQVSMLFIPAGGTVPAIGEEIGCRVRFTATGFDRVVVS